MKLEIGSPEYLIAARALAEEFDLPSRNRRRTHELFMAGPLRVFMREWERRDAADPEVWNGRMSTGWEWRETDPERKLIAKWRNRAAIYAVEHGEAALRDIRDWLYESADTEADWLRNVDALDRPKKLMKCSTFSQLLHEARKWERLRSQTQPRERDIVLGPDDEAFAADAGDGCTVVRLLSPAALDVETRKMGHCIGRGAYDENVRRPDAFRYYSLRNSGGDPLATIEGRWSVAKQEWLCEQFRGHGNCVPEAYVRNLFLGVYEALGFHHHTAVADEPTELPPLRLPRR